MTMPQILALHERAADFLGYIPTFLNVEDPRPAKEQFNEAYGFAGGWRPMDGWTFEPESGWLRYPGDPTLRPMASILLRDETIFVYKHAWVVIVQPDGSFEIARMD